MARKSGKTMGLKGGLKRGLKGAARRARETDPPLLTSDEERDLAALSQRGDPRAVEKLVRAHLRYVEKIARKYRRYGVPMPDLVQEGTIGLMHAIRRFDPAKGTRLATYAGWWVRSAIQEHVVKSWSMVRGGTSTAQKALFFRLRRMMADLRDGADALTEDLVRPIAARFNVPLKEAMSLARRIGRSDPSLNQHLRADSEQEWIDHLPDDSETPEESAAAESEARFCRKAIASALARLPHRERVIIAGRYLSDLQKTRAAIGRELGLSKERVRQLEQKALETLRRVLDPMLTRAAAR